MFKFIKVFPALLWLIGAIGVIGDSSDTKVNVTFPSSVDAGKFFDVEVEIEKGDLADFARFIQKLPNGLHATPIETNNAAFYFTKGEVRFIWMKLPSADKFSVKYRVHVNSKLKGSFDVNGGFYYLTTDKKRDSKLLDSSVINIIPDPNQPLASLVDIKDFGIDNNIYDINNATLGLACIRQKPSLNSDGSYNVNIVVNRGNMTGFSKVVEFIPEGYTIEPIDVKGATFQFKNQEAKFLWKILPLESQFVISYKVIPEYENINEPQIQGKYSYIDKNATISYSINEKNINLLEASPKEIEFALAKVRKDNIAVGNDSNQSSVLAINSNHSVQNNIVKQKAIGNKVVSKMNFLASKNMLIAEKGLYYRVQIAASRIPINIEKTFSKLHLNKDVKYEKNDGWYKYSVGSFPVYRDVKRYRDYLWTEKGKTDAFVTAYSNGKRITIQEALIASHHEWIK